MTKTNLGIKRICTGCGARFYDLGSNPAKCPKCGVMNDVNAVVKTRRRSKATAIDNDDPLVKVAAKQEKAKPKIKKPIKEIEDVDLEEFEGLETLDTEEEIEELEEIEDIDSLEELEEIEEPNEEELSSDIMIEGDGDEDALIDAVDDGEEEEEEEDSAPKPAPKKKGK